MNPDSTNKPRTAANFNSVLLTVLLALSGWTLVTVSGQDRAVAETKVKVATAERELVDLRLRVAAIENQVQLTRIQLATLEALKGK